MTDPAHDRAFFGAPPQGAAVQTDTGTVEDEQTILEQLLSQCLTARRIDLLPQARQGAAQPTAEQPILHRVERGHEQPFHARNIKPMTLDKLRAENHRHFLVVLRGDPDVAALAIEQVQAVVATVKTERQGTGRRMKTLLHPRVHRLFVNLHSLKFQATDPPGEMPG
ncbi:hypothetical protein D3C79_839460 [compost metagenome]